MTLKQTLEIPEEWAFSDKASPRTKPVAAAEPKSVIKPRPAPKAIPAPKAKPAPKRNPAARSVPRKPVAPKRARPTEPVARAPRRPVSRKPAPAPVVEAQPVGVRVDKSTLNRSVLTLVSIVITGLAVLGLLGVLRDEPKSPIRTEETGAAQGDDVASRYARGEVGVDAGDNLGFRAMFPAAPAQVSSNKQVGDITLPFELLTAELDNAAFQVGRVVYPETVDVSLPRLMLRGAAEGGAATLPSGELVDYRELTIGGDPAAGFEVSASNGMYVRSRIIMRGRTLYMIQVVSRSDRTPGFDPFVESFRIL